MNFHRGVIPEKSNFEDPKMLSKYEKTAKNPVILPDFDGFQSFF